MAIDRIPDVTTCVVGMDNTCENNRDEYRVNIGLGQEFGIDCITSSFFRSEWQFESGASGKSNKKQKQNKVY